MDNKQEHELVSGFQRLCPAGKNMMITVLTTAVAAEEAVKRELGVLPKFPAPAGRKRPRGKAQRAHK